MPFLVLREPGRLALTFPIENGLLVGRHEECRVILAYGDVSRRHARFDIDGDQVIVRDLGSRSGTFVNGVRLSEASLRQGDTIRIGPAKLTFTLTNTQSIEQASEFPTLDRETVDADDPRLRLVFEIGRAAFADVDPDELLGRMLEAILRVLGADRAVAALCEGGDQQVIRHLIRHRDQSSSPDSEPALSTEVVQSLLGRKSVILRYDQERATSAMGAPLQVAGRLLGFLYVDDSQRKAQFNRDDLDFLNALACLTAAALDSAERYQRASAVAEASTSSFASFADIMGQSTVIHRLKDQIRRYAASSGTHVLICGESGTGKELVAKALHAASPRAARPFVAVNCAAIPEAMLEGELFGYEKGAFTGALRGRKGRFLLAHRGTLLLDEIGDLSLAAQAKVLRATQNGEVYPLGAEEPISVDVRIVAATHKDLRAEVAAGRFREDLYFRLNVVDINVPPLRDRVEDVLLLAQSFLEAMALNMGKRISGFSPAARIALSTYSWPGNVRELKNEIERAVLHTDTDIVQLDDLGPVLHKNAEQLVGDSSKNSLTSTTDSDPFATFHPLAKRYAALDDMERTLVEEALVASRGNFAEAARLLGITRIMLKRRIERYGLRARDS